MGLTDLTSPKQAGAISICLRYILRSCPLMKCKCGESLPSGGNPEMIAGFGEPPAGPARPDWHRKRVTADMRL